MVCSWAASIGEVTAETDGGLAEPKFVGCILKGRKEWPNPGRRTAFELVLNAPLGLTVTLGAGPVEDPVNGWW